jgi:hypothetical protein
VTALNASAALKKLDPDGGEDFLNRIRHMQTRALQQKRLHLRKQL